MKLYIATTSLNFDTIMSTESISPESFYSIRGFGVQHMYDKVSLSRHNSILLFDKLPKFSISNKDIDHRPLVIEIDDTEYPNNIFFPVKEIGECQIYQTSKTIYLSPKSSTIWFLNQNDYQITLKRSENITETKSIIYTMANSLKVVDSNVISFDLKRDHLDNIQDGDIDTACIRQDIIINKAKGFFTGYLTGLSRSLTPDSARMLKLSREISNIICSFSSKGNIDGIIANKFRELIKETNNLTWSLDSIKVQALSEINKDLLASGFTKEDLPKLGKYFEKRDLYATLIHNLCPNAKYINLDLYCNIFSHGTTDQELDNYIKNLESYTNSILRSISFTDDINSLICFERDLRSIDCRDKSIDTESCRLVNIFYNIFSNPDIKAKEFKENRIDHCIEVGSTLSNAAEINFDKIRPYINGLLDNLDDSKPFNIASSDFIAMKSLGAFIQAPDKDIAKLISKLVSNEIADYRIAMGLWGLIYGYSDFPNHYFLELTKHINKENLESYINFIWSQIYGYESSDKNNNFLSEIPLHKDTPAIRLDIPKANTETKKGKCSSTSKPKKDVNINLLDQLPIDKAVTLERARDIIIERLKGKGKDNIIQYYISEIERSLNSSEIIYEFKFQLDSIGHKDRTKGIWEKAKREIVLSIKEKDLHSHEATKISDSGTEYGANIIDHDDLPRSFIYDNDVWSIIEPLLPADKLKFRDILKNDIEWFKEQYLEGIWKEKSKVNKDVVTHLEQYLQKKKTNNDPKNKWIFDIYSTISDVTLKGIIVLIGDIYR